MRRKEKIERKRKVGKEEWEKRVGKERKEMGEMYISGRCGR